MITLVLGGTRSGKSEVAEQLAVASNAPVTYVATAALAGDDADLVSRIAAHRARRPAAWSTVEETSDLAGVLASIEGTVLVDALTTWVAGAAGFAVDVDALCKTARGRVGDTIFVSDEVGLAVHAPTESGRRFADALGDCNRAVAAIADRVLLVVAGRTLELDGR